MFETEGWFCPKQQRKGNSKGWTKGVLGLLGSFSRKLSQNHLCSTFTCYLGWSLQHLDNVTFS